MPVILLGQVNTDETIQALARKYILICEQQHLMGLELEEGIRAQKHQCPDIGLTLALVSMKIFQEVLEIKP